MRASSWDSLMSALAFNFDKVMRFSRCDSCPRVLIIGNADACPSSDHSNPMTSSLPLVVSDMPKGMNKTEQGEHLAGDANKEIVITLPCGAISPRPDNRQLDPSIVGEIAASFSKTGQAIPVIVRPLMDGTYELIDGHHRLAAKELAGKQDPGNPDHKRIDCIIRNLTDAQAEIQSAVANIQKPLTQAEKGRLYERIGIRVDEMRSVDPSAFDGLDRGSAIASCASEGGTKVSKATVYRSINAAHAEDGTHEYEGMSERQRKTVSKMRKDERREASRILKSQGEKALDAWIDGGKRSEDDELVALSIRRIRSACAEIRRCEKRGCTLQQPTKKLLEAIEIALER